MRSTPGVKKMNNILIKIRTLSTRCLKVRVNGGIQTAFAFLKGAVPLGWMHTYGKVVENSTLNPKVEGSNPTLSLSARETSIRKQSPE